MMLINNWKKQLEKLSGNLTTNEYMPEKIRQVLLEEDSSLRNKLSFEEINFPKLSGLLGEIKGLEILSGLKKINKKGCLTLYRAMRFPPYKRMYELGCNYGCAIANYEQERILELYNDKKYKAKRNQIQKNKNFWVIPQERVVCGLPAFSLVNDALQIHQAFRGKKDKVVMMAIHIPHKILKTKVRLIANPAIDESYDICDRDYEIKDFVNNDGIIGFDYSFLRAKGIDLYEIYAQNMPWSLSDMKKIGISHDFFLLDIYEIQGKDKKKIKRLFDNNKLLKENQYFLHGFRGDQNIFARRESRYLPIKCRKIGIK